MIKKTIHYEDFDENKVIEDWYFNMSEAELTELQLGTEGGFSEMLQRIVASENLHEIMATFRKVILLTVGKRSFDNKRFSKSDEITAEFVETGAYSAFFMELMTGGSEMVAEFIRGVMPASLLEKTKAIEVVETSLLNDTKNKQAFDDRPSWIREDRDPTKPELLAMSPAQLQEAFMAKLDRKKNAE